MKIYDYNVKDAEGKSVSLKDYEGKVLLIVNTATGCGFTPQYEGLQDLYEKYQNSKDLCKRRKRRAVIYLYEVTEKRNYGK